MSMFSGVTWSSKPAKILRIVGVVELLVAALFVYLALQYPIIRTSFFVTAGIMAAVGIGLLVWGGAMRRRYDDAQRLKATGLPGRATVLSMRQTGVYLNQQPQVELDLQVEVAGQAPYRMKLSEWVPLIALGRLSGGTPLPVRVDPKDPQNVIIDWEASSAPDPGGWWSTSNTGQWATPNPATSPASVFPGAVPTATGSRNQSIGEMPQQPSISIAPGISVSHPVVTSQSFHSFDLSGSGLEQLQGQLRATGIDGMGRVDSVTDTGVSVGANRLMVVVMTVTIPERPPYKSSAPSIVAPDRIPRMVIGAAVPVKVDPNNPHFVLAEWDRA
jgi:hypothetical protein